MIMMKRARADFRRLMLHKSFCNTLMIYFYGIELQSPFIKIGKKEACASDPVLFLYHKDIYSFSHFSTPS